ncbi:MAG: NmrA/HSCARG family protein [Acidobacteriota bacterium]
MPRKSQQRIILVTGATGKQGGAVVRHLRGRGFSVRALTRDPAKPAARELIKQGAEVVRGDMENAASLASALDEAHGVFGVQTPYEGGVEAELRQGKNLASAAQRAGVRHFVYSSVGSADQKTGIPHFDSKFQIEEQIRGSGMPFTILRPVFFMENLLGMAGSIREGKLALPLAPDKKLQMIAVDDIGAFATMAFEHPQKWIGRAVDLAGDEITMADLAALLTRVTGREVKFEQVPIDDFESQAGKELGSMWRWFGEVGYHADIPALRQEYPRLTSLNQWAQAQNWNEAVRAAH